MEPKKTEAEIRHRLDQIDHEHFNLTNGLNEAPGEFEESGQGDDNANESELTTQKLAGIRSKLEQLEHERMELHKELESFQKAA